MKPRDAGERVHFPLPFHKGVTGETVPFYEDIIGNFMVYQDRTETFIASIRTPRNFRLVFYNFRYYF